MNQWDRKCIELKYKGYTYPEIVKAIGKKYSEGHIKKLFMMDGRLYLPYLQYEAEMSGFSIETAKKEYKRLAPLMSKVKLSLLQSAIKDGDKRLAWDIAKDMEDRSGMVVVKKVEHEKDDEDKQVTDQELYDLLTRNGLDPKTGLRVRPTPMEQN